MKKNKILAIFIPVLLQSLISFGQSKPLSERMASTVLDIWSDSSWAGRPSRWTYEQGLLFDGFTNIWQRTGNKRYFDFIKKGIDSFVQSNGSIRTYNQADYDINNVKNGRSLLMLYSVTRQEKYLKAASHLRHQISTQPRTNEGGLWNNKEYPYQIWLENLYMAQPFYAEFAAIANDHEAFNDIARQFILMERRSRDINSGLLYHGYDESREQQWADKSTGHSHHFWGRAMGLYGMALVDVLEYFPLHHPKRDSLISILNRFAASIQKAQDAKSGVWFNLLNMPDQEGNYLESSASSSFVYTIAKGVRLGFLPTSFMTLADRAFAGIKKEFVQEINSEKISLSKIANVGGLGSKTFKDGSHNYYLSENALDNDLKGVGAFLSAANEMELAAMPKNGRGKTVTLDQYFNNEYRKDASGVKYRYHYTWEDKAYSGFSLLGNIFETTGVKLNSLSSAPTTSNLSNTDIYIIVDPDTEKETQSPNYATQKHADELYDWVSKGGVLVLLTNDFTNSELKQFNTISERFGIHFNDDIINAVKNDQYETGSFMIPKAHPIFKTAEKIFIKEISTLKISAPAKASFTSGKNVVMATAKVGKGTVFAVGDPWFYNEYLDGIKLPAQYENFKAATDLVNWLIAQVPPK